METKGASETISPSSAELNDTQLRRIHAWQECQLENPRVFLYDNKSRPL
jgi:hypothetical protein